jgi:hypothetical protein
MINPIPVIFSGKKWGQAQIDFVAAILVVGVVVMGLITLAPEKLNEATQLTFGNVKTQLGFPDSEMPGSAQNNIAEEPESFEDGFYQSGQDTGMTQQGEESGQQFGMTVTGDV